MKVITGNFLYPSGAPAAGATLKLLLSQDAGEAGVGQFVHVPVVVTLDENGAIPAETEVIGNDEVLPYDTFYVITVIDDIHGEVYFERLAIEGTAPVNLNALVPIAKP